MEWERHVAADEEKKQEPWYGGANDEAEHEGWSSDNPFASGLPPPETIRRAYGGRKGQYGSIENFETEAPRRKRRSACLQPPFPLLCILLVSCVLLTAGHGVSSPTLGVATETGLHKTRPPTSRPTRRPSSGPARPLDDDLVPTGRPTSIAPSIVPSLAPTLEPSSQPSRTPTPAPSPRPSAEPTFEPSPRPTGAPSPGPTRKPTPEPTFKPSKEPTFQPSAKPSPQPSAKPSRQPSERPTAKPVAEDERRLAGAADAGAPVAAPTSYDVADDYEYETTAYRKKKYHRSKTEDIVVWIMVFSIIGLAVMLIARVICHLPPAGSKAAPVETSPLIGQEYNVEDCAVAVPVGEEEEPLHYEAFRERDDEMICI
mmetsp:Transcript_13391/g.41422  ORF Transcript_13391/g.41422 Transcript_13391/m.41422 type:complete len:371 (-) Transcript_13391:41-1153(-)